AAEIPIVERLVKEENEVILDQDSGAIGTMEFLQKGKHTEETQNSVAKLLYLVVSPFLGGENIEAFQKFCRFTFLL
ncbi:MAG: hypothetical protein LBP31_01905, partial [Holosporales bacterium]|nr:hypothetical protein [Holosporales bacterium]